MPSHHQHCKSNVVTRSSGGKPWKTHQVAKTGFFVMATDGLYSSTQRRRRHSHRRRHRRRQDEDDKPPEPEPSPSWQDWNEEQRLRQAVDHLNLRLEQVERRSHTTSEADPGATRTWWGGRDPQFEVDGAKKKPELRPIGPEVGPARQQLGCSQRQHVQWVWPQQRRARRVIARRVCAGNAAKQMTAHSTMTNKWLQRGPGMAVSATA